MALGRLSHLFLRARNVLALEVDLVPVVLVPTWMQGEREIGINLNCLWFEE
jgi:hypothetical protein